MIRNIIFDYGSVLIKTDCRRVYSKVFGSWEKADWFRMNVLKEDWLRRLDIGEDYGKCVADLQREYPDYADEIAMYDIRYADFVVGEMPGMNALLSHLEADGYHLFGLTNYSHKIYDIERQLPVFHHLEGQIVSSDVHIIKPDARIFRLLLAKYGLTAEECLFIDDREANVVAARALGMAAMEFPEIAFTREQIMAGLTLDYSHTNRPAELVDFEHTLAVRLRLLQ